MTITEPTNGQTWAYDGTPIRVFISATVEDPEDGSIPFANIDWTRSINGGSFQPITLQTQQFCFFPPVGPPICGPISYYIDLQPAGSSTSTRFDFKATVRDSGNQSNSSSNGRVTVFITQLI